MMRHFLGLSGRNLRSKSKHCFTLMHCYFTLHKEIIEEGKEVVPEEEPFYVSEIVYYSNNPHWCALPKATLPECERFFLIVWDCSSRPLQIILKMQISLQTLEFVETDDFLFPSNTLIFWLSDGPYVLPEIRKELVAKLQIKPITTRARNQRSMSSGSYKPSLKRNEFLSILEKKRNSNRNKNTKKNCSPRSNKNFSNKRNTSR